MSLVLRICLITASILTMGLMIHKIRSSKVQIEDAIYWVIFSIALIVLSVFPQIVYLLSDLLGVESPANLIFLLVIFALLVKVFTLSVRISGLETRIKELAQKLALTQAESGESADEGIAAEGTAAEKTGEKETGTKESSDTGAAG